MARFIRLDMVGHWKGKEHRSSVQGWAEDGFWENGISCYLLEHPWEADTMANLYDYWINVGSMDEADLKRDGGMVVTIFEGERLESAGMNGEDLAECTRTIIQFDATELYNKWRELENRWENDEETNASFGKEYIEENADELLAIINKHLEKAQA